MSITFDSEKINVAVGITLSLTGLTSSITAVMLGIFLAIGAFSGVGLIVGASVLAVGGLVLIAVGVYLFCQGANKIAKETLSGIYDRDGFPYNYPYN